MAATRYSRLDAEARDALLRAAVDAIDDRLTGRSPSQPPDLATLPTPLALAGSCFVSLHTREGLRGCCGTVEPVRALALDVWRNAQASAFGDPRFPPLAPQEWLQVTDLEIAVLGEFETLDVGSESDLLRQLAPGVDGLVLSWRGHRATFLPKVWGQVTDAADFLTRLKEKAGWRADFWADDLQVTRYSTECVSMADPGAARTRRQVG
jgi:AmmeMemoRadiSam system protein A